VSIVTVLILLKVREVPVKKLCDEKVVKTVFIVSCIFASIASMCFIVAVDVIVLLSL